MPQGAGTGCPRAVGTARSGGPRQWRRAPELSASRRSCCGACTNRWPSGGGVPAGLWTVPAGLGFQVGKGVRSWGKVPPHDPRTVSSFFPVPPSRGGGGSGSSPLSPTSACGPSPSAPAQSPVCLGLRGGGRSSGRGGPLPLGSWSPRPCREGWPGEAALHLRILPVLFWNLAPLSLFLCPPQPHSPPHTPPPSPGCFAL